MNFRDEFEAVLQRLLQREEAKPKSTIT